MKPLWLIPVCFVSLLVPVAVLAGGGQGGFEGVVDAIESQYHVRATRVPFLWLANFAAHKATHGVEGIHVAEFDNLDAAVDGEALGRMVEQKLGPGWERTIRETSREGSTQTLIFVHPEGNRMGLFIVDLDGHELDVVQVSVDPDHLNDSISHYEHSLYEHTSD